MRAIIQRVSQANVKIKGKLVGEIGEGLLVLLGVGKEDTEEDIEYLIKKILNLRIFGDEKGKMNVSLLDIEGELLIVSQFTLYGDVRKGRRPSFTDSASPDKAKKMYEQFIKKCIEQNIDVETGEFGAEMDVSLINDGPVTILLDSKKNF